jgi:Fur family ferric uptake transcriptional regulator
MAESLDRSAQEQYEELCTALSSRDYRLTHARLAILRALVSAGGHISADDLVAIVREQAPQVGRMTVYRTLDLLSQLGAIRPVYLGTGAAHYVVLHEGHHHHLVCSSCHRVVEIHDCRVGELEMALAERYGFDVQGHLVEFYGVCAQCRAEAAPE